LRPRSPIDLYSLIRFYPRESAAEFALLRQKHLPVSYVDDVVAALTSEL